MSYFNVEYTANFFNVEESDNLLAEMIDYPFEQVNMSVRGKVCKPLSKVCAYSDVDVKYSLSKTCIKFHPWNQTLLDIKQRLEQELKCEFNNVLLNLYENGVVKIDKHKDNESFLDRTAPIAFVSFGATCIMQFHRKGQLCKNFELQNGSLLTMRAPTNHYWAHCIEADTTVNLPTITLTFRKMLTSTDPPVLKRVKPNVQTIDLKKFEIGYSVYISVQLFNGELLIHLRKYNENEKYETFYCKEGVFFTPMSWFDFIGKIYSISSRYPMENSILNNSMIAINGDCSLKVEQFNSAFFIYKNCLTLNINQIESIKNSLDEINEFIIDYLYSNKLKYSVCMPTSNNEDTSNLKEHLESTLAKCYRQVFQCFASQCFINGQDSLLCLNATPKELYNLLGSNSLMLLDVNELLFNFSDKLSVKCDFVNLRNSLFQ